MSQIELPVGKERLSISINQPKNSLQWVLFLFGGSKSRGKERFAEWQEFLATENIGSMSFDYSGTGKSTGEFSDSSLEKRIDESVKVFTWMKSVLTAPAEITVCGGSMGAYVALGLMSHFREQIRNLILFCPAAYEREAHRVRFGSKFKKILSHPDNWRDSLAFDWLEEFKGRLLFILPERDEIVSADITQEFLRRATHARSVKSIVIQDSSHTMLVGGRENAAVRKQVYRQSVIFLKNEVRLPSNPSPRR